MKIMAAMHGIQIEDKKHEQVHEYSKKDHNEINRDAAMKLAGLF